MRLAMAIGLLATLAPSCTGDSIANEGKLTIRPGDTIVMLGDSITHTFKWWAELENTVNLFYTKHGLALPTWIDSGVDGDATNDIDVQTRILNHGPDVLIYGPIGFNDVGNRPEADSIASYTLTWNTVIEELPNVRKLAISPWVRLVPGQGIDSGLEAGFQSLRTAFAAVCEPRGIPYVDIRAYWDNANYSQSQAIALNSDGAHPTNPAGRALISGQVSKQIIVSTR